MRGNQFERLSDPLNQVILAFQTACEAIEVNATNPGEKNQIALMEAGILSDTDRALILFADEDLPFGEQKKAALRKQLKAFPKKSNQS